jgi:hypothetical protein
MAWVLSTGSGPGSPDAQSGTADGYQPFRIVEFPAWWVFTNFGTLLAGALMATAVRHGGTRAGWLAIPVVPASFGAYGNPPEPVSRCRCRPRPLRTPPR